MPEDQLRAPFEELLLDLAELVVATDDVGVTGRTLTIDGQPVPLNASGAVLCHKWKVPCLVPPRIQFAGANDHIVIRGDAARLLLDAIRESPCLALGRIGFSRNC